MRATIYLSDGGTLVFAEFDARNAMDMVAELHELRFAQFAMDDGTVIVNTDHIVRIDLDD